MKFNGNINLQYNKIKEMVVQSEENFPTIPVVGRVAFVKHKLYMCVALNATVPVWVPLTNKIDTFIHAQDSLSSVWTITHNLNTTIATLQIYDSTGSMIIPDSVRPISNNAMEVLLSTPITGKAVVLFGQLMPEAGIGILEPV